MPPHGKLHSGSLFCGTNVSACFDADYDLAAIYRDSRLVWELPWACIVNIWRKRSLAAPPARRALRHEFVIGPPSDNPLFQRKARLYFCIRCKWSFLVCERQIIVLDKHGTPLTGAQSSERFNTLESGPCLALEALHHSDPVKGYLVRLNSEEKSR